MQVFNSFDNRASDGRQGKVKATKTKPRFTVASSIRAKERDMVSLGRESLRFGELQRRRPYMGDPKTQYELVVQLLTEGRPQLAFDHLSNPKVYHEQDFLQYEGLANLMAVTGAKHLIQYRPDGDVDPAKQLQYQQKVTSGSKQLQRLLGHTLSKNSSSVETLVNLGSVKAMESPDALAEANEYYNMAAQIMTSIMKNRAAEMETDPNVDATIAGRTKELANAMEKKYHQAQMDAFSGPQTAFKSYAEFFQHYLHNPNLNPESKVLDDEYNNLPLTFMVRKSIPPMPVDIIHQTFRLLRDAQSKLFGNEFDIQALDDPIQ